MNMDLHDMMFSTPKQSGKQQNQGIISTADTFTDYSGSQACSEMSTSSQESQMMRVKQCFQDDVEPPRFYNNSSGGISSFNVSGDNSGLGDVARKLDFSKKKSKQQQQSYEFKEGQNRSLFDLSINNIDCSKQGSNKDRFIPNRKASKLGIALTSAHDIDENYYFQKNDPDRLKGKDINESCQVSVLQMYKSHVLGLNKQESKEEEESYRDNNNIFKYQQDENFGCKKNLFNSDSEPKSPLCSLQDMVYNKNDIVSKYNHKQQSYRKISKVPFKVLDAPQLQDDYYLNLIDWSSTNQLAVALAGCVYLWNATSNKVTKFCDLSSNNMVTSIQWNPEGTALSIGTSKGEIEIWDAQEMQKIAILQGHEARVGSLAWSKQLLASGSRDKTIQLRDLRVSNDYIAKLTGHKQEVCGIKWSFDGQQLASGGNDNKLMLWNAHSSNPIKKFNQHCAAVKALAWSPHQHSLLASGGGTADRTIRFWNTHTGEQVNSMDTGSQVCNLMFCKQENELVSTHGYSMNQICLWKYPTMEKIADLYGHTSRVLFLAASPDGETLVTGAGDETLRFWRIFQEQEVKRNQQSSLLVGGMRGLR